MATESAARRKRAQAWLWEYLQDKGCEDCGETHVVVLDFDHKDSLTKNYNVSRMVSQGYSIPAIEAEIEKCRILCTSCHRFRTAKEQQWYSSFIDYSDPENVRYWYETLRETNKRGRTRVL